MVNYGLLERLGERWQISHALIHTYARKELPLSKESLERLAAYYIDFCEMQSAAGLKGYASLDRERMHCLRLMESCLDKELWQEVQGLVGAIYTYLNRQGWWTQLQAALEMRLTAAGKADDHKSEAWCLNCLGCICERRMAYEDALAYFEKSLPIYRRLRDKRGEGWTLNNIAAMYRQQGKHEQALEQYQQCLTIRKEVSDRGGEGATLNNIAWVYYAQGDYETALQHYEQCLPIWREVGYKIGEGTTLNNIAAICRGTGRHH